MLALAFDEPAGWRVRSLLSRTERAYASDLLAAEVHSAFARDGRDRSGLPDFFTEIDWVRPTRPLTAEIDMVCQAGRLRGADLWHVACALYLRSGNRRLAFVTLDHEQSEVAAKLGFATPAARWIGEQKPVSGAGIPPALKSTRRGRIRPSPIR